VNSSAAGHGGPPSGVVQRVLKVYRGIKPLLNSLPILPLSWRASLGMFIHAVDVLALAGPEITNGFKAGKDL
jgi:hypothetical protein